MHNANVTEYLEAELQTRETHMHFLRQACQWPSAGATQRTQKCTSSLKSRCDTKVLTEMTWGVAQPGLCVLSSRCLCRVQAVSCRHAHARTHRMHTRGKAALGLRFEETWCFPAGRGHRCLPTHVCSTTCRHWCLSVHVSVCHCQCVSQCCPTTRSHGSRTVFVCNCALALFHNSTLLPSHI